jgi:myo-inositol 2-dehydrogenase/D-chiro-inositol 1-dehydrogenase
MSKDNSFLSVGVIGTGGMGARHARNLHNHVAQATVAAIMDVDLDRARSVAAECGGAKVFGDAEELIRADEVQALVIASPDVTHRALTLECLRHNKPVLCEKPLATTAGDAKDLVDAESQLGRRLVQVGFMRQYDPRHVAVKKALDSGSVGRPILFKGWHHNQVSYPGMTSELVVIGSSIHDIYSAQWLLGQEIEEVFIRGTSTGWTSKNWTTTGEPSKGATSASVSDGVLDLQLVQMALSGGCLATIEVNMNARYGYEVGVKVTGEDGVVGTEPSLGAVLRRDETCSQRVDSDWLERFDTAYRIEIQQWVKSVQSGIAEGPSAWDGYTTLLAAEACLRSLRSGLPEKVESKMRPALYASPQAKA